MKEYRMVIGTAKKEGYDNKRCGTTANNTRYKKLFYVKFFLFAVKSLPEMCKWSLL